MVPFVLFALLFCGHISQHTCIIIYDDKTCDELLTQMDPRKCCQMPLLLPQPVVQLCMRRPLPPLLPGEVDPLPYDCLAECALNITRILIGKVFRVEQARKVLLARVSDDSPWTKIIDRAVDKCYKQQLQNAFYLQDVAQNRISSQCVPFSTGFMGCAFAIMYRDCPASNWTGLEKCSSMVSILNNCRYLFKLTTII
ncbi:uncharacterized protein LOC118467177 [Anopheles albimanus]|uniref:OBP47-like domain-containing protein n=1 Tax=Anopheles albimanus TaxID=7167 RepID=A0A8W7K7S5_ANOAL|nr:uncharacterized protein LOC118467177 [Anopheles albimanus]